MSRFGGPSPPKCPFCDRIVPKPQGVEPIRLGDFTFGDCECGAVFSCDVTGHNLGAAYVEALGYACKQDWDLAWSLMPESDYTEALLENYDELHHLIQPSGRDQEGRRTRGVLTFIKLAPDIAEAIASPSKHSYRPFRASRPRDNKATAPSKPKLLKEPPKKRGAHYSKRQVEEAVRKEEFDTLGAMALEDSIVLRRIQRLLYSPDDKLKWKAIKALAKACFLISDHKPSQVGDLFRRLLYASNDSAAANWGSIEAMGEIIYNLPTLYGSFLPHLIGLINDPPSRPAIMWALGRIAQKHPELVRSHAFFVMFDLLQDSDPDTRAYAAWALGCLKAQEAQGGLKKLLEDHEQVTIYDGSSFHETTIGEIANDALKKLNETGEEQDMAEPQNRNNPEEQELVQKADKLYQEANMLSARGMTLDAMEKYGEALAIFEELGKEQQIANVCDRKGDVHIMRGDIKTALPNYLRALTICEKHKDHISWILIAEKITDIYRKEGKHELCLPYFFKGLEFSEELKDATRAGIFLAGIGDIYQKQGKLKDALESYQLALKIFKGMGSRERAEIVESNIQKLQDLMAKSSK